MSYRLLAFVVLAAVFAMVSILWRLFVEYEDGSLTPKTLLVGGFLFAVIFGLFAAGVQVLLQRPGL